ncbi:ZIP family metal transporter [Aegicerativicinus sediminis]
MEGSFIYILPILAVIIGVLITLFLGKNKSLFTKLLLPFSGAFLLALTLFDLLPHVYESLDAKTTGLLIMIGILIQIVLEFFSKGAEHGHIHLEHTHTFPWLLFLSLCAHSLLEGFPISESNTMVYGILIHKVPIAAVMTVLMLHTNCKKWQVWTFLILFALMTPLGTFLGTESGIFTEYLIYINAIVIGIFLHISTTIIFETGKDHSFNLSKLLAVILGFLIAYFL